MTVAPVSSPYLSSLSGEQVWDVGLGLCPDMQESMGRPPCRSEEIVTGWCGNLLRDIQIGSQTSWVGLNKLLVSLPLPAALSLPKC